MPYDDTKFFIRFVLTRHSEGLRTVLHESLEKLGYSEGAFYNGIAEHAPFMNLTSEEWYDLLSKLPNRMLRSQIDLHKYLSQIQIDNLPTERG